MTILTRVIIIGMINRLKYKGIAWLDLNQPTDKEMRSVIDEFSINPFTINDLMNPSVKSKVEIHEKHIFLTLHFPVFKHSHSGEHLQEVDFVVGDKFLMTVRYDTVDPIEKFQKQLEVDTILHRNTFDHGSSGELFFEIIKEIYQSLFDELDYIAGWINKIELDIFSGKEREMVFALSDVSRTLLNFRKATSFHREVLKDFHTFARELFDNNFSMHVSKTISEYERLESNLRNATESMSELRETNNSLVSTKQNEIMKTLTIIASVAFPMTVIAAIFGMSSPNLPIVNDPNAFWIIVGIMFASSLAMFLFFVHKRWV
jgi:magnesium transporter